nr:MAG TPA: hypothetical protein [Caudoviricetes sp.]
MSCIVPVNGFVLCIYYNLSILNSSRKIYIYYFWV